MMCSACSGGIAALGSSGSPSILMLCCWSREVRQEPAEAPEDQQERGEREA